MEKLVIDRAKWRTGLNGPYSTGRGSTQLLNDQGFMCCLGFECLRRGASETDILDIGEPYEVPENINLGILKIPTFIGEGLTNSEFSTKAMTINDNEELDVENREAQLIDLFKANGIELEFEGEYVTL